MTVQPARPVTPLTTVAPGQATISSGLMHNQPKAYFAGNTNARYSMALTMRGIEAASLQHVVVARCNMCSLPGSS